MTAKTKAENAKITSKAKIITTHASQAIIGASITYHGNGVKKLISRIINVAQKHTVNTETFSLFMLFSFL